jgi:uncharacterized membrane protein YdjX (TVP38/TMEM64 family)
MSSYATQKKSRLWDTVRLLVLLVVMGGVFVGIRSIGVERLQTIIDRAGVFGPVAYVWLRAVATVFAPFSSGPLQMASGALFGFFPAVVYSVIGSTLGYSLSFWIARRYGRRMVERLVGDNIERVDGYIGRLGSLGGLVTARLVFYFAYDFIAYAAGLSPVKFARFFAVSLVLGVIPTALTIAFGLAATGGVPFIP